MILKYFCQMLLCYFFLVKKKGLDFFRAKKVFSNAISIGYKVCQIKNFFPGYYEGRAPTV